MHYLLPLFTFALAISLVGCSPKNCPPQPQVKKAEKAAAVTASRAKKEQPLATVEQKQDYDEVKIHDESDKTDLFAIPLDTSEADEAAEVNAMEKNMEEHGEK